MKSKIEEKPLSSLVSLLVKIQALRDDCDERARDDKRRPGKRTVYGSIASQLTEILKPFEERK